MPKIRNLLKFFGLFLLVYIGLTVLVQKTGLQQSYASFYCSLEKSWFNTFGNKNILLEMLPQTYEPEPATDVTVIFQNKIQRQQAIDHARATGQSFADVKQALWGINSYLYALMPSLFFISLVLVSPVNWRRKFIAIIAGLIILHIYLSIRLGFELGEQINSQDFLRIGSTGEGAKGVWRFFKNVMTLEITYMLAILLWIGFSFRKADFQKLQKSLSTKS